MGSSDGIVIEGAAKRFGRRWALRGASFRAEPGLAMALMGHNGSGKTTLLRIVATTLRPTRGGGRVFGHDLLKAADRVREHVGALYHAPGVYGDLTARENLGYFLSLAKAERSDANIEAALDQVRLAGVAAGTVLGLLAGGHIAYVRALPDIQKKGLRSAGKRCRPRGAARRRAASGR